MLLRSVPARFLTLVQPLDLDEVEQPRHNHHEAVRNDGERLRALRAGRVGLFKLLHLLLRAFERALEDLIHERARLCALLFGRKAKDGFADRMLLRAARRAAGGNVIVVVGAALPRHLRNSLE